MTKKDYIVIAKMLKDINESVGNKVGGKGLTTNQKLVFNAIVYGLGNIFIEDNPNFNREKFTNAIYEN